MTLWRSNHGTIFVNQLAGLKLIVKDTAGAVNWTKGYFSGIYQGQLNSTGDQVYFPFSVMSSFSTNCSRWRPPGPIRTTIGTSTLRA
jgi:hypothetical protein